MEIFNQKPQLKIEEGGGEKQKETNFRFSATPRGREKEGERVKNNALLSRELQANQKCTKIQQTNEVETVQVLGITRTETKKKGGGIVEKDGNSISCLNLNCV